MFLSACYIGRQKDLEVFDIRIKFHIASKCFWISPEGGSPEGGGTYCLTDLSGIGI